jgi:hypothetical protein
LRPHKVAHRGWVDAAGFLFNTDLIGVAETRRRILNLWESGVQVFNDGPNHVVRLSSTVRVDCANTVATPLVQIESLLSGVPLSQDEFELLHAPSHSVVFAMGGVACVVHLSSASAEAPEKWLDVAAFTVAEVSSLGAAFAAPAVIAEPQPFDPRAKLDGVPAEDVELRDLIAAIRSEASGDGKRSGNGSTAAQQLRGWLGGLITSISSWMGKVQRSQKSVSPGFTIQRKNTGQGQTNGWFTRLGLRLLNISRLSQVLGRRQAAYLGRMMDMFERGDITEALKHAIPLGDLSSLGQRPALGVPSPRTNLSILPWQAPSPRSIGLAEDFMTYLRQLYRSSFERLVAQNRIEEAAFVLAELLRATDEAVAFLERHGKLKLAAELAEARELPPGLVVRQWFMAGDIARAVGIARRTQSFADAVVRLEERNKEQAEVLRLMWAESLAEGGNYAGAVDVIWPIESHRLRALDWLDTAIEIGGPLGARMLVRKLTIAPEDFDGIRRRALTFLEDESFEFQETRLSFATALCAEKNSGEAQTLARVTARAVLRDAGQNDGGTTSRLFTRLVKFTGDGPLRTDMPPFPVEPDLPASPLLSLLYSAADCGSVPVHDAVFLPNGRTVVALGEIGVRLLTPDGRTITHFDYPAERLVISDNGNRAIALARRGEVWRLSRLDLVTWRGEDWCDAHIDAFAPDYDGSLWFVGAKGDFYAIDTHSKSFEALWRVPEAGDLVLAVARTQGSCSFLTARGDGADLELWSFRLPYLTLRGRTPPPEPPGNLFRLNWCTAFSSDGYYVDQSRYLLVDLEHPDLTTPLPSLSLRIFHGEMEELELSVGDDSCVPLTPEILGGRVVSPVMAKDVVRVHVVDLKSKTVTAQLFFAGANQVSTRLTETTLTVADNLGRVIVVDLRRNCSIRNFRI